MNEWLLYLSLGLYMILFGLITLYCLNQLYLFVLYLRSKASMGQQKDIKNNTPKAALHHLAAIVDTVNTPERLGEYPGNLPSVCLQLPVYNEPLVIERLLKSAIELDYPAHRLEIQILDDSEDNTTWLIGQFLQDHAEKIPFAVRHIRREKRTGFKAGALQHGLELTDCELIAIFDADFIIPRNFLLHTVPAHGDENTAVVQARWTFINQDYSLLTRLQAWQLHLHFWVEQSVRMWGNFLLQFNGTAGVWKKKAIVESGGWSHDTLTEDLDLSYRAQLAGWKIRFLPNMEAPSELPVHIAALKDQQFRWTKGGAECARKLIPRILASELSAGKKFQAVLHLSASSVYLFLFSGALLSVLLSLWPSTRELTLSGFAIFIAGVFCLLPIYAAMFRLAFPRTSYIWFVPLFLVYLVLSLGLSLRNATAVLQGLIGRRTPFVRTPKWGLTRKNEVNRPSQYWKFRDAALAEGVTGLIFMVAVVAALFQNWHVFTMFHLMLGIGLLAVFIYAKTHNRS